jgi:hypothetical protein
LAKETRRHSSEREREFLEERFSTGTTTEEDQEKGQAKSGIASSQSREEFISTNRHHTPLPKDFRLKLVEKYRDRQSRQQSEKKNMDRSSSSFSAIKEDQSGSGKKKGTEVLPERPEKPSVPPNNNWIPIGPSVVRQGQAGVKPATSGRVAGIAIASGGSRIYIASANGGVWRSNDTGGSWLPLMNAFDLNPTHEASDSLACGAIAIDPNNPDRIYVGTGEGNNGFYFGVGPVVSDDGGANWRTEKEAEGSPSLAGGAFYELALDPADSNKVLGATYSGLYRREPDGAGHYHWAKKNLGSDAPVTSVVVARNDGTATFYAAQWSGLVYSSTDGDTWNHVSIGFPTANVGRIGLAVQPNNSKIVYALINDESKGEILGVWRLDVGDNTWRQINGHPEYLFGGQGEYDLAIAVDPNNANLIYLGGSTELSEGGEWSGSLYRCLVSSSGSGSNIIYTMKNAYIGNSVHADIHALVFAPSDSNKLWVGCDGGVFYSTNPVENGNIFQARNTGLATLTMNHMAQHHAEDAVLFCGTQDNGGHRFTGEEAWLYSSAGDSGYFVINWNDPYKILDTYTYGTIRLSINGGKRGSRSYVNAPLADSEAVLFYAPLAGTPYNPANPSEASIVAFGSERPWISTTFGSGWKSIPEGTLEADRLGAIIRSLTFASATILYAGTTNGEVYLFENSGTRWNRTRIDTVDGNRMLIRGVPVTDIAVDPGDVTGKSIYITLGGKFDYRHVWHFDGVHWQQRSGPAEGDPQSLFDVQTNAIAIDPDNVNHIYVGADIGCWKSTNGGSSWKVFSDGLPDAAVMDLKIHPRRLIRASTHGRGVFERTLDDDPKQGVDLYIRHTQLDQGRFVTVDNLPDPTEKGLTVQHWRGPDIKLDTPDINGSYQFPLTGSNISFLDFVDTLTDDSQNVATHPTKTITTKVYVQVHNRGVLPANNVQVMLLLTNLSAGLPNLPSGVNTIVQSGKVISDPRWKTIGTVMLHDIRVGFPKIASFDLSSDMLPKPANLVGNEDHCVLALVHHEDDPFTNTETNTDSLSLSERKAARKNIKVVQFSGTLPKS